MIGPFFIVLHDCAFLCSIHANSLAVILLHIYVKVKCENIFTLIWSANNILDIFAMY